MPDHEKNEEEIIVPEDAEESEKAAIQKAKKALKKCEKEKKEYLDGWKRAKADALNEKKRQAKLLKAEQDAALGRYVSAMLPILDAIQIASNQSKGEIASGIEQIQAQCLKSFSDIEIEIINPTGETFNPHEHQSIGERISTNKKEDNTVVEVARMGAKRKDIIIRAAMVYVGKYENKDK